MKLGFQVSSWASVRGSRLYVDFFLHTLVFEGRLDPLIDS